MKKTKNEIMLGGDIEQDYLPSLDTDDDNLYWLKWVINNELTEAERNAILYYSECQSQRELAEKLGVSLALTNKYLKNIKTKICNLYYSHISGYSY